jgi:hypothetical protein
MKKVAIGALAGGVVMFIWGAFSHMVLPIGKMGLKSLPSEDAVMQALRSAIPEDGLYFFPGLDLSKDPTPEEQSAWESRYRSGPAGLLLFHPQGGAPLEPTQLLTELFSNVLAAAVAAFVASLLAASYGRRAMAIALLGLFAWLSISASHWNWYGFPGDFIFAEGVDQVVGWLLAGLVIARLVPPAGGPGASGA